MATFTITKTAGFFADSLQNHYAIESLSFFADLKAVHYDLATLSLSTEIIFTTDVALDAPQQAEAITAVDGIGSHVLAYVAENMTTLTGYPAIVSEGPEDIDIQLEPQHRVVAIAKGGGAVVNITFFPSELIPEGVSGVFTFIITLSGGSEVNINLLGDDVFLNGYVNTFKITTSGTYTLTAYKGQFSGRIMVARSAIAITAT